MTYGRLVIQVSDGSPWNHLRRSSERGWMSRELGTFTATTERCYIHPKRTYINLSLIEKLQMKRAYIHVDGYYIYIYIYIDYKELKKYIKINSEK